MTRTAQSLAVHGVIDAATSAPAEAPPHRRVAGAGGLAFLLSPLPPDDPRTAATTEGAELPDQAALAREAVAALHHNALLSAYARAGDVVPARFGGAVTGEAAARALLEENAPLYRDILARLSGKVEFGLRVRQARARPAAVPPSPPDGRRYLAARRAARDLRYRDSARREAALAALNSDLSPVLRARTALSVEDGVLLSHALLVDRRSEADLVTLCRSAHANLAEHGLALELSGPRPAYSFARTVPVRATDTEPRQ